ARPYPLNHPEGPGRLGASRPNPSRKAARAGARIPGSGASSSAVRHSFSMPMTNASEARAMAASLVRGECSLARLVAPAAQPPPGLLGRPARRLELLGDLREGIGRAVRVV